MFTINLYIEKKADITQLREAFFRKNDVKNSPVLYEDRTDAHLKTVDNNQNMNIK